MIQPKLFYTLALIIALSSVGPSRAQSPAKYTLVTDANQVVNLNRDLAVDCYNGNSMHLSIRESLKTSPFIYLTGSDSVAALKTDQLYYTTVLEEQKLGTVVHSKTYVRGKRSFCIVDSVRDLFSMQTQAYCLVAVNPSYDSSQFPYQCQQQQQQQRQQRQQKQQHRQQKQQELQKQSPQN